jgi:hypothetical protein
MAKLLFVPVGSFSLKPAIVNTDVKLGSVMIARTDVIRRFLIGIAPFLTGTCIILSTVSVLLQENRWNNPYLFFLGIIILFQIGNTMFSSKKDMEGVFPLFLITSILFGFIYLLGFRFSLDVNILLSFSTLFQKASFLLSIPICLDTVGLLALYGLRKIFS